jgi:predicted anti-sigma-YlaC factor YlaD
VHDPDPPRDGHPSSSLAAVADEITCRQFVELVTDYFEGAVGRRTLNQVEEHLVMCDWCVTYADHMETIVTALHELKDGVTVEPPETLLAILRARSRV